jgi:hypothetical protein
MIVRLLYRLTRKLVACRRYHVRTDVSESQSIQLTFPPDELEVLGVLGATLLVGQHLMSVAVA